MQVNDTSPASRDVTSRYPYPLKSLVLNRFSSGPCVTCKETCMLDFNVSTGCTTIWFAACWGGEGEREEERGGRVMGGEEGGG